jgi:hypothetical protein
MIILGSERIAKKTERHYVNFFVICIGIIIFYSLYAPRNWLA